MWWVRPFGVEEGFTDSLVKGQLWRGGQAVGLRPRGAFLWLGHPKQLLC